MTNRSKPFGDASRVYLSRGWHPIPVPYQSKAPPPVGWTGYLAPYPSGADVEEWAMNGLGSSNVALRMPSNVLGIDLDAYGVKQGAETMASAVERLGPLPPTPVSSSRSDQVSGIRFYRVPPDRRWADTLGPDVEIIHHGHRYAVVAPSVHPSAGRAYCWWTPDWKQMSGPAVDDLPFLPQTWVDELDRGSVDDVSLKADVTPDEVTSWLADLVVGTPCRWVSTVLDEAGIELAAAASRHDTGRRHMARLVRAGEQGHEGVVEALGLLHGMWLAAMLAGESREPDYGEWERMVTGAVAIVTASPTPTGDRGCCGPLPSEGLAFDPDLEAGFWEAREVLGHLHLFARSRMCSPWAVLGITLARVVTAIPPFVVLPALVGGYGSLNLFIAPVGVSGMGKGAAESAASDAVSLGLRIETATIGSGEGIAHLYAHREKGGIVRDRDAVLFTVPEVDNLTALGSRQGATLLPQLRMAWSGERLGFSYADKTKALPIEKHSYRMGLVLGIQPGRARTLMEDVDGGTPQRFVYVSTSDPGAPDVRPESPDPWKWKGLPSPLMAGGDGKVVMDVCEKATEQIDTNRRGLLRLEGAPLDAHALLARLKVAAALALLDCRLDVNDEDWELATTVMKMSDHVRNGIVRVLKTEVVQKQEASAKIEGRKAVVVAGAVNEARARTVAKRVLRAAKQVEDEWVTWAQLHRSVSSKYRDVFEEALELLISAGMLKCNNEPPKPLYKVTDE